MNYKVPHILLSLADLDTVSIERQSSVDDVSWSQVTGWWSSLIDEVPTSRQLDIPLVDFYRYLKWVRTHWTQLGNTIDFSEELRARLKDLKKEYNLFDELATTDAKPPDYDLMRLNLKRKLTDFQVDNILCLLRMPNGANFSVPGAGKTTTTLVLWAALREKKEVNNLLVIAPRSAFEAWHEDAEATFNDKHVSAEFSDEAIDSITNILIVNYEQLQNPTKLSRVSRWASKNKAMVCIDEAHRIKGGAQSVRWLAIYAICKNAPRVDLLTGTPMPQGFQDLKNLYSISWSKIQPSHFTESKLRGLQRGGVFVRTTKNELDLPEPVLREISIPMGEIQSQVYSSLMRAYVGTLALNNRDESLMRRKGKAVLTLIAAATNPGLISGFRTEKSFLGLEWPPREVKGDHKLLDVISNYAAHEMPAKYTWTAEYVNQAAKEGRKVLVWSNFVGNLLALQNLLKPYNPALVYGAIDNNSRKDVIDRFRHDSNCHVLLTNPQTLGEGVSLHHECHDAIYIDRTYNAGIYLQSLDRIHRLGLAKDQETRVFVLSSDRTIDNRVSFSLATKVERMSGALNDPGLVQASLPHDLDGDAPLELSGIDSNDLEDLFAHLPTYE